MPVDTQLPTVHSCSNLRLLSCSFLCRPFSLSCYQSLASCSSLTSLTIDLPGDQRLYVDHAPLGQLTNLRKLALCYELPEEGQLWQVATNDLARLTKLQQLMVKGFVPAAAEVQQQQLQQSCLPASLTSLVIEGGRQLDEVAAEEFIQLWHPHTVGCSNLQQLQLINLCSGDWGLDFDFGRTAHLKELHFDDSADRGEVFGFGTSLPASITKLTDLEVLWLGTLGSPHLSTPHTFHHFWDMLLSETDLSMDALEQCPRLRQLGPVGGGGGKSSHTAATRAPFVSSSSGHGTTVVGPH